MEAAELQVKYRDMKGKSAVRKLRSQGYLPAVIYGRQIESVPIMVKNNEFEKLINRYGENSLINLLLEKDGKQEKYSALIREVQRHHYKEEFNHIDFYQVSMKEKLDTVVSVYLSGEPKSIKDGGILQHGVREIDVRCLPGDIPEYFEIDISELDIGENVTVGDIEVGEEVEITTDRDTVIALVMAPSTEEEIEEEEDEELAEEEGDEQPEEDSEDS